MKDVDMMAAFQKPFDEDDIQWRVQQAGVSGGQNPKPYIMAIPYVSNRAIQKRLDDTCGVMGWENAYKPTPDGKGYVCGITIHGENRSVTKWDGAEYTQIEALKGALSDSMKRCAVQWGIGRYLYKLDVEFAKCQLVEFRRDAINCHTHFPDKKNRNIKNLISWENPQLPIWAIPFVDYGHLIKPINEASDIPELHAAFKNAYLAAETAKDTELEQRAIAAKDKRKEYIISNHKKLIADKEAVINEWLDTQLEVFNQLPNKSTIDSFHNNTIELLATKMAEQGLTVNDLFIAKISGEYNNRINEINNKTQK